MWRGNRQWLGFLPDAGFEERARQGTLLAALCGDEVVGYVLYDLPGNRVKLVHVCVADEHRGTGIASLLVNDVSARHRDRRGIELRCRRDFPANRLWPKLGFRPVAERPGRSHKRHPLDIWLRSHGLPDLFTPMDEQREVAVIDNNVFSDLATGRPQGGESRLLEADWISELVELCITDELLHEIHDCDDAQLRVKLQRQASGFRVLETAEDWRELEPAVRRLAAEAGVADHRHVARAVRAGATYFVTRDGALEEAASAIEKDLRLIVLRPEELIRRLDRLRAAGRYEPEALAATEIVVSGADVVDQGAFVAAFLNYAAGERAVELRRRLREALANPDEHVVRLFQTASGRLLGALVERFAPESVDVTLARVSATDRIGRALARQLSYLPRQTAANREVRRARVVDPTPSAAVERALPEEAYTATTNEGWVCHVDRGFVAAPGHGLSEADAASIERRHWPCKVVPGPPVFMLSINAPWAEQLFDTNLAAKTLFGRSVGLGLSREHVYYRRPGAPGGIVHPARILWYVKGGIPTHRVGHIRAVSLLEEVVVGPAAALHRRFQRLGVWDQAQVRRAAGANGQVMALRFVDTALLEAPIGLEEARRLYAEAGLEFMAPQSPRRVPERMFCLLYQRGSAYA
jgi:GNAT superfamily N-acetyltransferase/predicted nucleic acid-binding protein